MSVIVDVLETVCSNAKIFSYKDPKDFRALWGLNAKDDLSEDSITKRLKCWAENYKNEELTVVIVYDGMPDTGGDILNVSGFVSPHDWAMAASWSIYENDCLKDMKLRILILNVVPSVSSFASRFLFAFQNALPWIQDYRVVGSAALVTTGVDEKKQVSLVAQLARLFRRLSSWAWGAPNLAWLRQAFPPETRDLEIFTKDLLEPSRVLTTHHKDDDRDRKHDVLLTCELWKQNLLKAETRHSVANLVAPAVLASGLPQPSQNETMAQIAQGSLMSRALISTLREVGFLTEEEKEDAENNNGLIRRLPFPYADIFGRPKEIQFVLVDDHFDLGYDYILGYTLFGSEYSPSSSSSTLKCYKNLDWLINALPQTPIDDWKQPRYLFENKCDVLLLDLRLWTEQSYTKEMQKIVCAARQLLRCTSDDDVPPKLKEALDAAQTEGFSPKALTLLPLLLSHIDRMLPIVLFTSSHQRAVTEMLRDFPNVITSFAKPLVSGYGEAISPADSVRDLEDAIKKAIALHQARIAWKRICKLDPVNADFNEDSLGVVTVLFEGEVRRADFRRRLADLFKTCVFGDVYESISQPWEFLEYEIAESVCNIDPNLQRHNITTIGSRGYVALALKNTRNEKTHGKLDRDSFELDRDSFEDVKARQVAVLQLLFLLDFLEGTTGQSRSLASLAVHPPDERGPEYVLWLLADTVKCELKHLQSKSRCCMRNLIRVFGLG